jgi:myo-inositol-1(or 4)-monophosphatase
MKKLSVRILHRVASTHNRHNLDVKVVGDALVGFQIGDQRRKELVKSYIDSYQALMVTHKVRGIRSLGSAAINMVCIAQGSLDAFVEYGIHCWDIAAAGLILKEAGGALIDPTGSEFNLMGRKVLCAATPELAKQISSLMTHTNYEPEG